MRTCIYCSVEKPLSDFAKAKQTKDGFRTYCKACATDRAVAWNRANPDKVREIQARRRLKRYGITDVAVLGPLECGACGSTEKLCIDHDHNCCQGSKACGKCVRGWLCKDCNVALGILQDSVKRLDGLKNYLVRSMPS